MVGEEEFFKLSQKGVVVMKKFKPTPDQKAKKMVGKVVRATWKDHMLVTDTKLSDMAHEGPQIFTNYGMLAGFNDHYFIVQMAGNPDNANDSNNDHYKLLKEVTMLEVAEGNA